jgi:hypothetical protein
MGMKTLPISLLFLSLAFYGFNEYVLEPMRAGTAIIQQATQLR